MTIWKTKTFSELTTIELYELLKLRVDVFVVEQTCPYPELDNKDQAEGVHHLLGYEGNELIACARLLPKGTTYDQVSIGRVATKQTHRGGGLGHDLLAQAKHECERLWPNESIQIGAQPAFLRAHYRDLMCHSQIGPRMVLRPHAQIGLRRRHDQRKAECCDHRTTEVFDTAEQSSSHGIGHASPHIQNTDPALLLVDPKI